MKRENFTVKVNGIEIDSASKYNAALRKIEKTIREIAVAEETIYYLTKSESTKEGFYHTSGLREWTSKEGKVITFIVSKL